MSWLSELFHGGGSSAPAPAYTPPADNSAAVMKMQIDYLNSLRADQAAKEEKLAAQDPTATRQAALGTIGGAFAPEFQSSWLPGTATDALEAEYYGKQRGSVDEYLNNLLKRGVITDVGFN